MQIRIENILEEMQPAANISQLTKCKHDEVGKTKNHFLNINNDAQESAMREEKREREWKSGEGKVGYSVAIGRNANEKLYPFWIIYCHTKCKLVWSGIAALDFGATKNV